MKKHGDLTQRACKRCGRAFWSADTAAKICQSCCDRVARTRATGKRRKVAQSGQLGMFTDEAK
jgi:hypothetical protein